MNETAFGIRGALSLGLVAAASAGTVAEVSLPDYRNSLIHGSANPAADDSTSAVFFNGSVGAYIAPGDAGAAVVPTAADSGIQLASSSFSQPLSAGEPYPMFVQSQVRLAQEILYPDPGLTREQIEGSGRAFRYKPLLFDNDGQSAISSDFERISEWYGEPERAQAAEAISFLADGLKIAPGDPLLRNALLDAYYDLAVAEAQFIKNQLSTLAEWRLGLLASPSGGFIINEEIATYETILESYRATLGLYGELLGGGYGRNVRDYDAAAPAGMPFGLFVFLAEQPRRNQYAASFVDIDGILKTVPDYDPDAPANDPTVGEREILSGYKDYALLLSLLKDYGEVAAELARVYGLRKIDDGTTNDVRTGLDLIARVQQELYLTQTLLEGLLDGFTPVVGDGSGIAEALNRIETAKADLDGAQSFLVGETNALGFDPDFLVLIQEFPDSTEGNQFDSYDAMIRWIRNTGTSPLNFAETAYVRARDNYDAYRGYADQVFNQFSEIQTTVAQRYFEITGHDPGDPGDHRAEPAPGSELWQIEAAIDQLGTRNEQLIELDNAIDFGLVSANQSVNVATGLMDGINAALYDYQGTIRSQRNVIAGWSAAAAAAQATYDTVSDVASMAKADDLLLGAGFGIGATVVAGAANASVQFGAAKNIAEAEKLLDLASAEYDAALEVNDTELVINQAIENRDSLQREKISNTLEFLDNQSLLAQEIARRESALGELDRLLRNRESTVEGLAGRYYADPVHFLRAQNDMIKAELAFKEAQEWVFFVTRALEFKWNRDFEITHLGRDWSMQTLFALRNFRELEEMVGALEQFNTTNLFGFTRENFVDRISLRDDVLAPAPGTGVDDGLRYDFVTSETVSATELMRRKLDRGRDTDGNLVIRLDTFALDKRDGFFFLGPEYNSNGTVFSAGKYLDKIDWIKLNAVTTEANTVRTATLSYGGTCYIRNRIPPCLDPSNPFVLEDEFRSFPFRYFFTLDNGDSWRTRQDQQDTVKLVLSPVPAEPDRGVTDSTLENRFLKERSVATTDLVLRIPAANLDINQLEDLELYINHLFVSRELPDCN